MHDPTPKPKNLSHSQILPRRGSSVMDNTELLESFDFACKVKNLTPASHKCYAERLTYLVRFADSIDKGLDALTQKDITLCLESDHAMFSTLLPSEYNESNRACVFWNTQCGQSATDFSRTSHPTRQTAD